MVAEEGGIEIGDIMGRVMEEIAVVAGGQIRTTNVKQVRVVM